MKSLSACWKEQLNEMCNKRDFRNVEIIEDKILFKENGSTEAKLFYKKEQLSSQLNFNFVTNNLKGFQFSKKILKRVKLIEYFRNKMATKGISFLQETCASVETKKQWSANL